MNVNELKEKLKTTSLIAGCIYQLLNDKDIVIVDYEKRKILETSQTFSLDNDYISHIEEFITYEYYVEYAINKRSDCISFKFKDINALNYVDELIKNKKRGIRS